MIVLPKTSLLDHISVLSCQCEWNRALHVNEVHDIGLQCHAPTMHPLNGPSGLDYRLARPNRIVAQQAVHRALDMYVVCTLVISPKPFNGCLRIFSSVYEVGFNAWKKVGPGNTRWTGFDASVVRLLAQRSVPVLN